MIFFILKSFFLKKDKVEEKIISDDILYNSNIIENVQYKSKDTNGNVYEIYDQREKLITINQIQFFLRMLKD